MTQIQDLFVYPIQRDITTVIKMDDLRAQEVEQELHEYVVTDTIETLLIEFLERYAETRTGQTDRIGVWISGFFGSGKSHFAKILSYLLENRDVGGTSAVEHFRLRIVESPRRAELERLLHQVTHFIRTETIAFQIKTEEELIVGDLEHGDSKKDWLQANHISTILYRQWLKRRGFSTTLWVGRLEQQLSEMGLYADFTAKVAELEGLPWEERREHEMVVRDAAVRALCALLPNRYPTEARASKAIDDIQTDLRMGPSILAKELAKWVEEQRQGSGERAPHLVFIIDEMGQFIGDSNQKLLELQSIAEAFATQGMGKLWLIVTAQEALEEIVQDALQREHEFDKIRDRFNLRLVMTSENIETVLEQRILKKRESHRTEIEDLYRNASGNIGMVCTLQGASRPLPAPDAQRFIADYPFPPYQLAILQQIFAAVRTRSSEREKIEGTERSLIGVTQAVLKSPKTHFAKARLGRLVAFDEIYDQIESELPTIDRRTIDEAQVGVSASLSKRILKALYLIQKLEWIPCMPENLARLLVNQVDDPKLPFSALREQVQESLKALEDAHYVAARDGQYEFLSGIKKDIELDIAAIAVRTNDRRREVKKYLRLVLDLPRLNYQGLRWFDVAVRGDDEVIRDKGEVTVQVYSPLYAAATGLTRDEVQQRSYGDERTLYWFPAPAEALARELGKLIQTEAVVTRRSSTQDKSTEEGRVLYEKQRDVDTARQTIQTMLRQSLADGVIIYDGEVRELAGRTSTLSTIFTREVSAVIPHVYTRFEPAAVRVNEKSIEQVLSATDAQLAGIEPDLQLFDDAARLNRHTPVLNEMLEELRLRTRAGDPCDGKTLADFFESVPYGWDPTLVRVALAAMFRAGVVSLKYEGRVYTDYKAARARELLTKALDFRKTEFIYDPQEGLNPAERKQAQQALDRIFHRREPDTVALMATAVEEELLKLQQENATQRALVQQTGLPFKSLLVEGQAVILAIQEQPQADRRLKALLQHVESLKALREYQAKVREFIEAGRPAEYRRAHALLEAVTHGRNVVPGLNEPEVQRWLEELRALAAHCEIVEKWGTFVQNQQPLLRRYQAAYEQLHAERQAAYTAVQAELDALGLPTDALADRLCAGPVTWNTEGLACAACGTALETLYYQIQSAPQEKVKLVARSRGQVAGSKPQGAGNTEQVVVLRLSELAAGQEIADEAALESVIVEIRDAVRVVLKTGKRVILE